MIPKSRSFKKSLVKSMARLIFKFKLNLIPKIKKRKGKFQRNSLPIHSTELTVASINSELIHNNHP